MMFDQARLELGLNALASLRMAGALPHVVVFALDPTVTTSMHLNGIHFWPLHTSLTQHLPSLALRGEESVVGHGDFSDKVLLKFVPCLSALALGYDVLWLDGDLVVFQDPLQALRDTRSYHGPFDLAFQSMPVSPVMKTLHHTSYLMTSPLLSGVTYASAARPLARRFLQEALHRQVRHYHRRRMGNHPTDGINYFADQVGQGLRECQGGVWPESGLGLGRERGEGEDRPFLNPSLCSCSVGLMPKPNPNPVTLSPHPPVLACMRASLRSTRCSSTASCWGSVTSGFSSSTRTSGPGRRGGTPGYFV